MAQLDTNLSVLVVDDSLSTRAVIFRLLKQLGLRDVEAVSNAMAALERLEQRRFAFILLDWHMAPMTGLDLLERLRCDDDLSSIPVAIMSADPTSTQVAKARIAGASGFLLKPFSANVLKSKIEQIFRSEPTQQRAESLSDSEISGASP